MDREGDGSGWVDDACTALGVSRSSPDRRSAPFPADFRRARRLIHLHPIAILVHMRTTLNIDDELLERARALTGVREKTALIHEGLRALLARESALRLARLGGSEPLARAVPRRRAKPRPRPAAAR